MMRFDVLTLFPPMFAPIMNESILKRAQSTGLIEVHVHDIRDAADDKHRTVDDTPYGGGTGMVLRVDVIHRMLQKVIDDHPQKSLQPHIILLTPQGERFTASKAQSLAKHPWIILICGHYEGFDERIREHLVDEQISIGEFVLTGGELPAMMIVDTVSRFVPGVLPEGAASEDTFSLIKNGQPAREYPHYTRPAEYKGWKVPDILTSGNHQEIMRWRKEHLR